MIDQEAVIDSLQNWMHAKRTPPDDATTQLILERVLSYLADGDVVAPAHFERAYTMLVRAGHIAPFAGALGAESTTAPAAAQVDVPLTPEAYHRLPASEVIRRYRADAKFKAGVDSLVSRGLI